MCFYVSILLVLLLPLETCGLHSWVFWVERKLAGGEDQGLGSGQEDGH